MIHETMHLTVSTFLLMTMVSSFAFAQQTSEPVPEGAAAVAANPGRFQMAIEAAGLATLPSVSLKDGDLQIDYRYESEGERRAGSARLKRTRPNRYEGRWATKADNGNACEGTLFFEFAADGTADGRYTFGSTDYAITIRRTQPTAMDQPAGMKTRSGFTLNESAPKGLEDVYAFYETNFGFVPNLTKVMANSPALVRSYVDTQNHLQRSDRLSPAEINIVQMAIAVENKCEYCVAGHTMAGQAFFKTPMDQMQQVRMRQGMQDPKLNALRNFAIQMYSRKGGVTEAELKHFLDAGYTRDDALDVVACIAAKVMSNYTNSIAKTPIDAAFAPLTEGLPFKEE